MTSYSNGSPPCLSSIRARATIGQKGGEINLGMKIKINKSALDKVIKDAAIAKAQEMAYDIECPHCHAEINVSAGKSVCPVCGGEIDLKFKFD